MGGGGFWWGEKNKLKTKENLTIKLYIDVHPLIQNILNATVIYKHFVQD